MSKLSQQVQELEQRLETLEYENNMLKGMVYRLIATHGNRYEPIPYSPQKMLDVFDLDFYVSMKTDTIKCRQGVEPITPNNTPDEL